VEVPRPEKELFLEILGLPKEHYLGYMREIDSEKFEFTVSDLPKCRIEIESNGYDSEIEAWNGFLKKHSNQYEFTSESEERYGEIERKLYLNVDTMEQLKLLIDEGINFTGYSGWFEFEKENEEMTDEDIIWAGNVEDRKGTKFGLVKDGLFKIVEKDKKTYIFLENSTLDRFKEFREEKKEIEEQELNEKNDDDANEEMVYETDQDYDKTGKERE